MKKRVLVVLVLVLGAVLFAGCGKTDKATTEEKEPEIDQIVDEPTVSADALVVYFSYTGNTKAIALEIAELTGADVYEIKAKDPYTEADTQYDEDTRAYKEQHDPDARPEIDGELPDVSGYNTVYLGYPIWHSEAPKIVYTFFESVDMNGKTIIPFCTSGGSPVGDSANHLHEFAPEANWKDGTRFELEVSKEEIAEWLKED